MSVNTSWVHRRWLWPVVFAGFFLLFGAWAVALPANAGPDETAHIIRASGVADGQIKANIVAPHILGALHYVPTGYNLSTCFVPGSDSAVCMPPFEHKKNWLISTAGRYFPAYYLAVGLPLNLWPGPIGVILARLISVALAAAFVACSFVTLARWSKHGLMLGALVVAVSPMVAHVAATINPNGLEIAAGIGLFASMIPLFLSERKAPRAPLVLLFTASAGVLVTAKTNGPVWLVLAVAPFILPWRQSHLPNLLRQWLVRVCIAAIGFAGLASVVWILEMNAYRVIPVPVPKHYTESHILVHLLQTWPGYVGDFVAIIGWGETRVPWIVYPLWTFAAGCLLLTAFAFGNRVERVRLALLLGLGLGVPFSLQFQQAGRYGFITQARYLIPLMVGVLLLAAFIVERQTLDAHRCRSLTRVIVVMLVPLHVLSLLYIMVRYQHGLPKPPYSPSFEQLNPLTGKWLPPTGPELPIVMVVIGAAVIGWLTWRRRPDVIAVAEGNGQPAEAVESAEATEATEATEPTESTESTKSSVGQYA